MRYLKQAFKWLRSHLPQSSSAAILVESGIHTVGIAAASVAAFVVGQPWLGLALAGLCLVEVGPAAYLAYKLIWCERATLFAIEGT